MDNKKEDCKTCKEMEGKMCPPHKPSDRCESGKRPHCTCPICWG